MPRPADNFGQEGARLVIIVGDVVVAQEMQHAVSKEDREAPDERDALAVALRARDWGQRANRSLSARHTSGRHPARPGALRGLGGKYGLAATRPSIGRPSD